MDLENSYGSLRSGMSAASSVKDDLLNQLDQEINADDHLSQSLRMRRQEEDPAHSMQLFANQVSAARQAMVLLNSSDLTLNDFPNADFFYKMVAKVNGQYFSVYDASV